MSLLLDALRKSEAQRRRGKPPALELGSMPDRSADPGSGRRRRLWLALAVALVVAALAAWQWSTIRGIPGPGASADFASNGPAGAPAIESEPADAAPVAGSGARSGEAVGEPPVRASAAGDEPEPDGADGNGAPPDAGPGPAEPITPPVATGTAPTPGESAGAASDRRGNRSGNRPTDRRRDAQGDRGAERDAAGPEPVAVEPERANPARPVARRAEQQNSASGDASAGAVRPWELPEARRAAFPELDVSVHFFATEPAERFVLINGERYVQGDRIGDDARVHEIVRDGVVVEFGDYLVLVE